MKPVLLLILFTLFAQFESIAQTEFQLKPDQSMLMTGKGAGQDGAINPYFGQDCYAIVENNGTSAFSIRIQQQGKIIQTIPIASKETKRVKLLKGYELYLDANSKEKLNARLDFEKIED